MRVKSVDLEFPFVDEDLGVLFIIDANVGNSVSVEFTAEIVTPHSWTSDMPLPSVDMDRLPGHWLPLLPAFVSGDSQFAPVELKGQVTLQTTFGSELCRLVQEEDVHLVLEIGTVFESHVVTSVDRTSFDFRFQDFFSYLPLQTFIYCY